MCIAFKMSLIYLIETDEHHFTIFLKYRFCVVWIKVVAPKMDFLSFENKCHIVKGYECFCCDRFNADITRQNIQDITDKIAK